MAKRSTKPAGNKTAQSDTRGRAAKDTWEKAFLTALRKNGVVTIACEAAGVGRTTVYEKRRDDPEFLADWDEAIEIAADRIEAEVIRRAVDGMTVPVYYKGEIVGFNREFSDSLAQMVLRAHKPEKYRERVTLDIKVDIAAFIADLRAAGIDPDIYFQKAQERIRLLPKTGTGS